MPCLEVTRVASKAPRLTRLSSYSRSASGRLPKFRIPRHAVRDAANDVTLRATTQGISLMDMRTSRIQTRPLMGNLRAIASSSLGCDGP